MPLSAYAGVVPVEDDDVDFAQWMKEIHKEWLEVKAESKHILETNSKNFGEMGGIYDRTTCRNNRWRLR